MGIVGGIWLAVLGILAVPSLIISKRPDAKDLIDKITPYQGWIGAISALWGLWSVISSIMNLGWLSRYPIYWITYLANAVLLLALGILLGVGVLRTFTSNEQALAKLDETVKKLSPYQGNLGIAAIIVGIWMIVSNFIFL